MTILLPSHLRTHIASQFKESITESSNTAYYVFAGKHVEDLNNTPIDSVQTTLYDAYNNMVFGKRVSDSDVSLLIPRVEWTEDTRYNSYDSSEVVANTNFYVAVHQGSQHDVFKVIDNNNGGQSNQQPLLSQTNPADEYYQTTSDGYVWKYMYSVTDIVWNKFVTDDFMPVSSNSAVEDNAVPGAIDRIKVVYPGSDYSSVYSGTFASDQLQFDGGEYNYQLGASASNIEDWYTNSVIYVKSNTGPGQYNIITSYSGTNQVIVCQKKFDPPLQPGDQYEITPQVQIFGDGTGAVARCLINPGSSNSVSNVEILSRGSGYTYATTIVRDRHYVAAGLGRDDVALYSGIHSNAAILAPVISPQGGHGSNAALELGATAVGVSVKFDRSESNKIPVENDYHMIGILKDPLFFNVNLEYTACTGTFTVGSVVTQVNTNATGIVTAINTGTLDLTDVKGIFQADKVIQQFTGTTLVANGVVTDVKINNVDKNFDTFDQRFKYNVTVSQGNFQEDEKVWQETEFLANAVFHSGNSTFITLTNVKGVINQDEEIVSVRSTPTPAVANVHGRTAPDLVKYSGDVIFLEYIDPPGVSRSNTQSEQIKIVLKF